MNLYKFMEEKSLIDRVGELDSLKAALSRPGPELVLLYGRRRVGKSRLLRELMKAVKADVFVMLEDADRATNLAKFASAVAKAFSLPSFSPSSFRNAFEAIPEKSVVFIDEFSYIAGSAGEFQGIWEEIAKPKQLKVVLSGSLIRIMEDLNYSLKSPLYGRATAILKLMPLQLAEVFAWYGGGAGAEEVFRTCFIVGGIPRYLEVIEKPSLEEIEKAFFSKNGLLLREGKLLLKESFPTSELYPKILFSVAGGKTEASKIANDCGVKAGEISKYLSVLADYGFVEKRQPVIGANKKSVRFYIKDRFIGFWSRFVWPYYAELESGVGTDGISFFRKNFGDYCGRAFEKTMMEILQANGGLLPQGFNRIGPQWGKAGGEAYEIDILAINEMENGILFAECKWSNDVDAAEVVKSLAEKTGFVEWNNEKRTGEFAVFAKSFKRRIGEFNGKKVHCLDLGDIEKVLRK